ncbi:hypothetical protein [Actinoplanes sp. G11-F43]|uniref:hypothetical protein n=1 Tax=Actinoplanes sp. G11-F43 TaxID=3424130 RepID=UPI003D3372CC
MRRRNTASVPSFVATPQAVTPQPPAAAESLDDWPAPDGLRGSSRQQAMTGRGLYALLWTLLIGAVGLGLFGVARPGGSRGPAPSAIPASAAPAQQPPGGCAELLVAAWLTGDAPVLATLLGAEQPRLPQRQRTATRTYTVSVQPGPQPATWSYVVGADVAATAKNGGSTAVGIQFFAVTLTRRPATTTADGTCAGWSAPALPAQVAGLAPAERQELAYDRTLSTSGQPLADTLSRFFTALLAGGPEIERYLAPGVSLAAVTPAPYTQVRLERLAAAGGEQLRGGQVPADGTQARLLATVAATVGEQPGEWRLTYPLSMAVRGGRWEITAIDAAPVLPSADTSTRTGSSRPSDRPGTSSGPAPAPAASGSTR